MSLRARSWSPPHKTHHLNSYRAVVYPIHPGGMRQGGHDRVQDHQPGHKPLLPAPRARGTRQEPSCPATVTIQGDGSGQTLRYLPLMANSFT